MYDVYQGLEGPLRLDSCLSDQKESDRELCMFRDLVEELRCEFPSTYDSADRCR